MSQWHDDQKSQRTSERSRSPLRLRSRSRPRRAPRDDSRRRSPRRQTRRSVSRQRSRSRSRGYGSNGRPPQKQECSKTIKVSQSQIGGLIGKGGHKIQMLTKETGARIAVSRDEGETERTVTIEGSQGAVQDAMQAIEDILSMDLPPSRGAGIERGAGNDAPKERKIIKVPQAMVGLLIGKGGESIRVMSEKSGAKIEIARKDEDEEDPELKTVTLSGTADAVKKATQMIEQTVDRTKIRHESSDDEEGDGLPRPPPGFEPCSHPTWLHHAGLNIYFERNTGCLCWFDANSRMFAPLHRGEQRPLSFLGQAAVRLSSGPAKPPAPKHVVIPDLHRAGQALKMNLDHLDRPASMVGVYGASQNNDGVPADVVARGFHEKLLRRLASYRSVWLDAAFLPALSGALMDLCAEHGGKQAVAAVALVVGHRVVAISTAGARLCVMSGTNSKDATAAPSLETGGARTCYAEQGVEAESSTSIILTVGESCLDDTQIVVAAAPQLFGSRFRAANVGLMRAVKAHKAAGSIAVACARIRPVAKVDTAAANEPKMAKVEEVVPKVRVLQILIRYWKGTGAKPTDPVRRKQVSRTLEEAEILLLGILDQLAADGCATFTNACKKTSECQSALKGGDLAGDLGWLERAKDSALKQAKEQPGNIKSVVKFDVPEVVRKVAFELKVGDLSDLIISDIGVHVLWRTG